jgi:hypothetical protein
MVVYEVICIETNRAVGEIGVATENSPKFFERTDLFKLTRDTQAVIE